MATTKNPKIALVMKAASDVHGGFTWIAVDEAALEIDFQEIAEASTLDHVLQQVRELGYGAAHLYDVDAEQAAEENLLAAGVAR